MTKEFWSHLGVCNAWIKLSIGPRLIQTVPPKSVKLLSPAQVSAFRAGNKTEPAHIQVGEYRLQGQDYYYTLQGWIKGVNGINTDPGEDGSMALVPKDVFAYNLGYYKDDYTAIGPGVTNTAFHLPMQAYTDLMGNEGFYNGNIAWMVTDLKKIGQIKSNRLLGGQAMLYRYDQLHRITQSRSLTERNGTGGFISRTVDPQAYDEDYSYDANGNLLTLHRYDENSALKDNFTYDYYRNTNKLKQLIPVVRDTTYSGAIASNYKVYENIDILETAYIPPGGDVVLKATQNIDFPETFDVPDDANMHAYVLPEEEGVFLYDAIGNLVWDQEQGVKIKWNFHGKVREVVKGDTTTIRFRYDGTGNRIEKAIIRPDKTVITRYVRDASGNVLAVYNDTILSAQTIYGSARLGLYQGGRVPGHRTLGNKAYEFSNHLGNVLAVITDNIYMNTDSAWTNIVSANDYYPFGLAMEARTYSDTTYRYGFNGQEKEHETFTYSFDYRMHDPRMGRFWSVDPMYKSFPWNSPYAFAENRVIDGRDLEGREWDQATDDHGNTHISVNIKVDFSSSKLTPDQINSYKEAISAQFNSTLQSSSDGKISGAVTFNGGDQRAIGRLIPSIIFNSDRTKSEDKDKPFVAGFASKGNVIINVLNKENELASPENLALTTVHELLHTVRLDHPFEFTNVPDTELKQTIPNSFVTTGKTDPNIYYNIMNYGMIYINGFSLDNLWTLKKPGLLTKGQLKFVMNEINLQKQGYGVTPKYDRKLSQFQNENNAWIKETNYWKPSPNPVKSAH